MTNQVKLAIADDFLAAYARLPKGVQGKVQEFVSKFRKNPLARGINLEKLNMGVDKKLYSVRIDNTYRGIVLREEETGVYLLLWVDHHDEAYDWAARKRCEVNKKNGIVQIFEVREVEETVPSIKVERLFNNISDEDLLELGVPELQIEFIKSLADISALINAKDSIPQDAFEYLSWLTEGIPIDEVLNLAKEERGQIDVHMTIAEALNSPLSLKSFVVVEGEDELKKILEEPLEKWRVFLHPAQRKIVFREYTGPARVLGGAGTGKTVVAIHRAKHLAATMQDGQRILFTTFTANLASDIKTNLQKICTANELRNIDVINLDAWVNQFLRSVGFSTQVIYDGIQELWENALQRADVNLPFSLGFYEEEWTRVVISQEALSLEEYVKASRNGRGTRLDRKKRMLVWKVFEAYQDLMKEKQVCDINTAMYECRKLLEREDNYSQYAAIIVDEGQDFGDNAYRLLRALAGEEHNNDIFIVGDAHQRIYRNRPSLSKSGINVRGRSSVLKINYRTTEEIRRYAFALLNGISFDDLDDGIDLGDHCQSLTHGEKPVVEMFDDADAEMKYLINEINELLEEGVNLSNICVVARTRKLVEGYVEGFTRAGIRSYVIKRNNTDDRSYDGLRVSTMHRVKGLEFQYVFVTAVNHRVLPLYSAIDRTDSVSKAESIVSEKCLLYVALTRAQKGAYITSYGKKSEFL